MLQGKTRNHRQVLETGQEKAEWAVKWREGCKTSDEAMARDLLGESVRSRQGIGDEPETARLPATTVLLHLSIVS